MKFEALSLATVLVLARFGLMLLEMALIRARLIRGRYTLKDTLASIGMRAGNYATNILFAGAVVAAFAFFYEHRLFDIPFDSPWTWVAIVVLDDFAYYWFHRISHECRFWWAAHVNHHSSQEYNLSTAIRQPWTGVLVGTWAPWFLLAWIGFPPELIFLQSGLNLLYQFWIHTEAIRRLPAWFEWLFNTPSNHRVHHASNPRYVDRNYAGIFMVWDRMFGTYAAEVDADPPKYGLIRNIDTYNPIKIAFHEWVAMARDVRGAKSVREVLRYVFGAPGWRPDGNGPTASNVRAEWLRQATLAPATDEGKAPGLTAHGA
jgi:sterol desaturase/sphingolipid hydroxylase (fatty acid hydroxylase superfamily)